MTEPTDDDSHEEAKRPAKRPSNWSLVWALWLTFVFGLSHILWPAGDGWIRTGFAWVSLAIGIALIFDYAGDYRKWRRDGSW